jgi:nuclease S1
MFAAGVFFLSATTVPAWAWGRRAHRASASLAELRLTAAAKAAVGDLLGPDVTLANVSTWADEVRREIKESGPWHYVNVPITETRFHDSYCPSDTGCVVSKIADFRAVLIDPKASREQKQKALKFLIHFVQDMHQPVHVGENHDRGGNDTQVQFFDQGSNLHRVWDSGLIEHEFEDDESLLREITKLATENEASTWPSGTVEDWANESFLAAQAAYKLPGTGAPLKKGAKLGQAYQDANLPVAKRRVAQSGVRLAAMLNAIFASPAN